MSTIYKSTLGFLAVFILITTTLYTQFGYAEEKNRPKRGPERMIEKLNLSDNQTEQFRSIMDEQHQKRKDIHEQHKASRETEREAMESLHQETIERLSPVLTAEQLASFEEVVKKHRPNRRHEPNK